MRKSRFTEEQIIGMIKEQEAGLARNALLDDAAPKIGVDQALVGLIDGGDKHRIADPSRLANFANQRFL